MIEFHILDKFLNQFAFMLTKILLSTDFCQLVTLIKVRRAHEDNRELKQRRRRRQRERQKGNRFNKQNNNFARAASFFLYISLPSLHDSRRETA